MTKESGKICMAKLARIYHRVAELDAERSELLSEQARIFDALAEGETVDMRTAKHVPRAHQPKLSPVTPEARAVAVAALTANANRRRFR